MEFFSCMKLIQRNVKKSSALFWNFNITSAVWPIVWCAHSPIGTDNEFNLKTYETDKKSWKKSSILESTFSSELMGVSKVCFVNVELVLLFLSARLVGIHGSSIKKILRINAFDAIDRRNNMCNWTTVSHGTCY